MQNLSTEEIKESVSRIIANNGGVDPIAQAKERLRKMGHKELESLVLIACNQVGVQLNMGNDFETPLESLNYFLLGIETVFTAYDNAVAARLLYQEGFQA